MAIINKVSNVRRQQQRQQAVQEEPRRKFLGFRRVSKEEQQQQQQQQQRSVKKVRFGRGRNLRQIHDTLSRSDMSSEELSSTFYSISEMKGINQNAMCCAAKSVMEEQQRQQGQQGQRKGRLCTRGLERLVEQYRGKCARDNKTRESVHAVVTAQYEKESYSSSSLSSSSSSSSSSEGASSSSSSSSYSSIESRISEAYASISRPFVEEAINRAKEDEKFAKRYLYNTRRQSSASLATAATLRCSSSSLSSSFSFSSSSHSRSSSTASTC